MSDALNTYQNDTPTPQPCRLSVLIPFYRESPMALVKALSATATPSGCEIILFNDGSGDESLMKTVLAGIDTCPLPVRVLDSTKNQGRAEGRNILTRHAKGAYFLFLDADMLPDRPDFLPAWLNYLETQDPDVCFGGFSLKQAPQTPEFALHRAFALHSDCVSADLRAQQPEKYIYTSNLLLKASVFALESFDSQFTGWGWEDVDWASRIVKHARIDHIDLTATHMGLDRAETLMAKHAQSVGNFARILAKSPHTVKTYGTYIWARRLKWLPGSKPWLWLFKSLAVATSLPVKVRALSLRLYRAKLYSSVV